MTNLELKSKVSLFAEPWGGLANANEAPLTSRIAEAMVVLKEFTGTMLATVGVTVLIGNLLVSGALLLRGPAFVIELLAK